MQASFTTPSGYSDLNSAATACGFAGFDWQQTIDQSPGGVFAEDQQPNPMAPTVPYLPNPLLDPPLGGYTYQFPSNYTGGSPEYNKALGWSKYLPNFATANPFYYSPLDIPPGCTEANKSGCVLKVTSDAGQTLNFFDKPQNATCPPTSPCFAFTTQLVGVCGAVTSACTSSGPSAPLYAWTWYSNFNGSSGGVSDPETSSLYAPDPGSGTGGVTVTSINGVAISPCALKQNGSINVEDVQFIINQALGLAPAVNDLSGDGVVNVLDVQIEINAAFGLGCAAN
jgi:hypothetical protein